MHDGTAVFLAMSEPTSRFPEPAVATIELESSIAMVEVYDKRDVSFDVQETASKCL